MVRRASGERAMAYTLSEAARAAGRGKTTLLRMIRSGRLSATRDPVTGGWLVEPVELHRLYPPAHREAVDPPLNGAPRIAELEARLEAAETRIRDKDELIAAHRVENEDLRQQRDRVQAALAVAQEQLGEALQQVRLLTDQRSAPPRRSWLPWRRRG
jgi:ATPase subunit of ABC transporter with duplicated ATPase domains